MNKTTINYFDLLSTIKEGILRHDKNLFLGAMLSKGSISMYELNDSEKIEQRLNSFIEGMAYNILTGIQEKYSNEIEIDSSED